MHAYRRVKVYVNWKHKEGIFWAAVNVSYLDLDGGLIDIYICKNPPDPTFIIYIFYYEKLYFNKRVNEKITKESKG